MHVDTSRYVRGALIAARPLPAATTPALTRWRRVWFPGLAMGWISLLLLFVVILLAVRFLDWAVVNAHWTGTSSDACPDSRGACWAFVTARWKPWLVGDYP